MNNDLRIYDFDLYDDTVKNSYLLNQKNTQHFDFPLMMISIKDILEIILKKIGTYEPLFFKVKNFTSIKSSNYKI